MQRTISFIASRHTTMPILITPFYLTISLLSLPFILLLILSSLLKKTLLISKFKRSLNENISSRTPSLKLFSIFYVRISTEFLEHVNSFIDAYWAYVRQRTNKIASLGNSLNSSSFLHRATWYFFVTLLVCRLINYSDRQMFNFGNFVIFARSNET